MVTHKLRAREVDVKALRRVSAFETDTDQVITEPGVYTDEAGKPLIIFGRFADPCYDLKFAVESIKYQASERTSGLKTTSRVFAFQPRIPMRRDFCCTASLANDFPKQHGIITDFASRMATIYEQHAPAVYARHLEQLEAVRPEWRIPGSPFTSGIVNKNNPLKYHFDFGNFLDVMSCMVVFRKDCEGGALSLPQYNVRFQLDDRSYFLFDGQSILHGVTPLKKLTAAAYRYSIVYYALRGMGNCESCADEVQRIRRVKRQRELRRLTPSEPEK